MRKSEGLQALGELTMLRTYSRDGEDWGGITDRYLDFMKAAYPHMSRDIDKWGNYIRNKLVVGSMRLAQNAGESVLKENAKAYNCSFVAPTQFKDFCDISYLLCCGCGVGFSVEHRYINQLPCVGKGFKQTIIIGDTKEAWADSWKQLLENPDVEFDYSEIRPAGTPLSTGGTASGSGVLKDAHEAIRKFIKPLEGKRLRSVEVADIICHIGVAIVSGGVRRSALICLYNQDDALMANFKSGNWFEDNIQRAKANISVITEKGGADVENVIRQALESSYGEPGMMLTSSESSINSGSNPCLCGETLVQTIEGLVKIKDLVGKSVIIHDGCDFVENASFRITGENKELFRITFTNGEYVDATEYHTFISGQGRQQVRDLKQGDNLLTKWVNTYWTVESIVSVGIADKVYCCSVPSTNTFLLGNGLWSGNCGEISLRNRSFCNLSEVIASNCSDKHGFIKACQAASFFGTLQAGLINFNYIDEGWRKNAIEESLLGVSITGQAMAQHLMMPEILREGAKAVVDTNKQTAKAIGINTAKRMTCTKPSGSTSCVMGTSSGIHAAHGEYVIRRIRVTALSSLGKKLIEQYGIKEDKYSFIQQDVYSAADIVLQFPCHYKDAVYRKNESAVQLLERMKTLYGNWVVPGHIEGGETNNVSLTVSVKPEEKEDVFKWMVENQHCYRGISVLPYDGGDYPQLPFQEVDKEEFDKYLECFPDLDIESLGVKSNIQGTSACAGGACEIGSL